MNLPIESLSGSLFEVGLVVAAVIGFGFGFVLERAGFGRATKLAAQFYLRDLTVFKVMFGAIVTAMLGLVVFDGLGIIDITALGESVAAATFLWPMLAGGLMLGAGFIISGYCPGTSMVAAASGNVDGAVALLGILIGCMLFGELQPSLAGFYVAGDRGHLFLYQLLPISPAFLAVIVALVAVLGFLGADKLEKIMAAKKGTPIPESETTAPVSKPRSLAFTIYAVAAVAALLALLFPVHQPAQAESARAQSLGVGALARRLLDEPWRLRIIDLREHQACAKVRLPGSECVSAPDLTGLGLAYAPGDRDLVLVNAAGFERAPAGTASYPGQVFLLEGGFAAWKRYALTAPEPLAAKATPTAREAYLLRAAVHGALTGRAALPPPPAAAAAAYVPKKKKGGGCD